MIKVKKLSKNYGSVEAVKSISFDLNDGEVIGFLGANGAGKTTTLKMITGYMVPTEGSITVNGLDIIDNTHEIQKQIILKLKLNYYIDDFIASDMVPHGRPAPYMINRLMDKSINR